MKGAHAEITHGKTSIEVLPGFDATHVLVAADTTIALSTIAAELRAAGYVVATCPYEEVVSYLRTHKAIELLVLDGTSRPAVASALLGALRVADGRLPIILVAGRDPELRAEAERLAVEALIDAPLQVNDIRRSAIRIAPVVREPRVQEWSNRSAL